MDKTLNLQGPDISIILPVYNVEKQLIRCLNSISSQKFSGTFEIIAVEAFSTDNSLTLLKSFQLNEPRLKIIEHGIREKLSTSRITGMNVATGDYILHIDSDDWILPDMIEKLFETCVETNADIVVFDYIKENSQGKRTVLNNIKKKLITIDKIEVQQYFYGACWNKIVKRRLIENLIYGEIGINTEEDLLYSTEILLKAEVICLMPESFYVYFVNTDSLSYSTKWEQYMQDQIVVLNQLQKMISKYKPDRIFIENVVNYFEKWIYLGIAKIHFGQKEELIKTNSLVKELFEIPIMDKSRNKKLGSSLNNKFTSIVEVTKRFGPRMPMAILFKSFKSNFK